MRAMFNTHIDDWHICDPNTNDEVRMEEMGEAERWILDGIETFLGHLYLVKPLRPNKATWKVQC